MSARSAAILFAVVFGACLLIGLPLGLALPSSDLRAHGFAFRHASGSVWSGRIEGATWTGRPLGDLALGVILADVLRGRVTATFAAGGNSALVGAGRLSYGLGGGIGLRSDALALDLAGMPLRMPLVGRLTLASADVWFDTDGCERARGTVTTDALVRGIGGISWSGPVLSGDLRCDGPDLMIAMAGDTGRDRVGVRLRLMPDRGFRAEFSFVTADGAVARILPLIGFSAQDGAYLMIQEGRWG